MGSLAQVLRELPVFDDPNLLVSAEHLDDAAVYRLADGTAIVQTLDFFPPLVDDPFAFGQVAAANSLSDVYAMGGKPLTCLNIVAFPDEDLPVEVLLEILKGGSAKIAEAGAVVAGGHSVRDAEIKYGLSVTGTIDPDRIILNHGARPGDKLVLTKPLGSGILTTAAKKGELAEEDLQPCIDIMAALNRGACEAMLEIGVRAATDITGFGLIGHAFEMADASGITIAIDAGAVPLMERAMEFAKKGFFTRAAESNLACVGERFSGGSVDPVLVNILADAQTSGGLFISVAADRADDLVKSLQQRGTSCAAIIGEVLAKSEHSLICR